MSAYLQIREEVEAEFEVFVECVCAKCGDELEANHVHSKTGSYRLKIDPCQTCRSGLATDVVEPK